VDQVELNLSLVLPTLEATTCEPNIVLETRKKKSAKKAPASEPVSVVEEQSPVESNSISSSSYLKSVDTADNVVIIKLSFEEHHRRLPFEHETGAHDVSFQRLADACTQFFGIKNIYRMVVSYQDEDGDRVQLSTDAELAYALDHYTEKSSSSAGGPPVLKLRFSVKPTKKQEEDASSVATPPASVPSDKESIGIQRKLKDGDVIVLQAQREGATYNVAFCKKEQKIVAARQEEKKRPLRKNVQWAVSKFIDESGQDNEELFFLSCKAVEGSSDSDSNSEEVDAKKKPNKKNLRVLSNAIVTHKGGRGVWARFAVAQTSSPDGQQVVTLRSVGRSKAHPGNNFLGITKNNEKASASQRPFIVAGNLNQTSDDSKFILHFV